jgi:tRNA threonylcarbamoyladenosine biosynthesis protein TsaB
VATFNAKRTEASLLIVGIDTCGPAGSVALARLTGEGLEVLDETALEGRTYSATLIAAIDELLKAHGVALGSVACIVVVSGPGSFTGVRIGLSAAKGLAEGADLKVVAVSRLEVLARKAGLPDAALDAHRHEVFLLANGRELLAGTSELAAVQPVPARIAVCEDAAAGLLAQAWAGAEVVRVSAPAATEAIALAVPRIQAGDFADVLLLDGHYIRRSDAEIFGDPANAGARR